MAKAEISLEELDLDGGDGGKGALTAIPRTPPTYSNIELIAVDSIRIPPDRAVKRLTELDVPRNTWLVAFCA